jgi:hypothetical protein
MDIIVILLLVAAAGAIYFGGTKFHQSLRSFLNVKITKNFTLLKTCITTRHMDGYHQCWCWLAWT